jgi:hypothetical protein
MGRGVPSDAGAAWRAGARAALAIAERGCAVIDSDYALAGGGRVMEERDRSHDPHE